MFHIVAVLLLAEGIEIVRQHTTADLQFRTYHPYAALSSASTSRLAAALAGSAFKLSCSPGVQQWSPATNQGE